MISSTRWGSIVGLARLVWVAASCASEGEIVPPVASIEAYYLAESAADRAELLLAADLAYQEHIATCMREAGFEYWAIDETTENRAAGAFLAELEKALRLPADRSEASARGFGSAEAVVALGDMGAFTGDPDVPGRDENRDYRDGLGDAALEQYAAMRGECVDDAVMSLDVAYEIMEGAFEMQLQVDERLLSNAEYAGATSAWQSCMAAAGLLDQAFLPAPEQYLEFVRDEALTLVDPSDITGSADRILENEVPVAAAAAGCASEQRALAAVDDQIRAPLVSQILEDDATG